MRWLTGRGSRAGAIRRRYAKPSFPDRIALFPARPIIYQTDSEADQTVSADQLLLITVRVILSASPTGSP